MPPILKIDDLTIAFGDNAPVVNGLCFELAAGDQLGILGLSGSGKSLTALACLGLLPAGARILRGSIFFSPAGRAPVDLLQLSEREWKNFRGKEISLVFQEPLTALNPVHRVGKQLMEAVRLLRPEVQESKEKDLYLREWLSRVELPAAEHDRILQSYPHALSGGQRQRLLIALALLAEPTILFADEPTTALDTITEAGILALLARLRKELNMTTVFITHDLAVLRRVSERVLVMQSGEVIRRGTASKLLKIPPGEEDGLFRRDGERAPKKVKKEVVQSVISETAAAIGQPQENPSQPSPQGRAIENAKRFREKRLTPTDLAIGIVVPALLVENLSISYSGRSGWPWSAAKQFPAVKSVDFRVGAGEWVALVGPSGCGKSSIARCLAGLLPQDSGSIQLSGADNVQLIFQDPFSSLNPAHSLHTILSEVLRLRAGDETADSLLAAVGLPPAEFRGRKPAELSGGQRQRVAIARSLAAGASLLIADEAVSALDVPLRADILDLLDQIRRQRGVGLLFISHDLSLVARRADRVLIMNAGRIVEAGDAAKVLAAPQSGMGKRLVGAMRESSVVA